MMLAVGVKPTAIYAHPLIVNEVVQAYMGTANYAFNAQQGTDQAVLGVYGTRIVTPAGILPLVSDHRFTLVDNGDGTYSGDLFIVTELYRGQPVLYLQDQIPWSYLDLARTSPNCTSEQFFIKIQVTPERNLRRKNPFWTTGKAEMLTRGKQPQGVQPQRLSEGEPFGAVRQSDLAGSKPQEASGNDWLRRKASNKMLGTQCFSQPGVS